MISRQLFDLETCTYTYLVADPASREAVLIDPVKQQLERDLQLLQELDLKLLYALDTHVHADHITASGALRAQTGCETGISVHAGIGCADIALREGDTLRVGGHTLLVEETPGHTPTCLSFVMPDRVFTGDCLLIRGCGRTDFQDGDAAVLYQSITEKLFKLDDATLVFPAHDYRGLSVSTIGEERRFNPRLQGGREHFIGFMNTLDLPDPHRMQEALPANRACGETDTA